MPGRELLSRRTRIALADYFSGHTLHEIDAFFEAEEFVPGPLPGPVGGQRRTLVAAYYAAIDWTSRRDVVRFLRVVEEAMRAADLTVPFWQDVLRLLRQDGYVRRDERLVSVVPNAELLELAARLPSLGRGDLPLLMERIEAAVDTDPGLAVGTAKEMLETICKGVLEEHQVEFDAKAEVPALVKAACKQLALLPESISDQAKGVESIRRTLANLSSVATGVVELRNLYGSGHGRGSRGGGLEPRHARLAVSAVCAVVTFLLETDQKRRGDAPASTLPRTS